MATSPITADDLDAVTQGATACDHLTELGNTRKKMRQLVEFLFDVDGNLGDDFKDQLLEHMLFDAAKKGWLVRSNPSTGFLELIDPSEKTSTFITLKSLRLATLDDASAVAGDIIRFVGTTWQRVTPFNGAPTSGGTTVPDSSTGGHLLAAHGLSAAPTLMGAWLECNSAELGYSVGDRVKAESLIANVVADTDQQTAAAIYANGTNVGAVFMNIGANDYQLVRKDTFAKANITETKWNVKFYAAP